MISLGRIPVIGQCVPLRPLECIGRVSLSIKIVLDVGIIGADELLVYFIQVIRLQYHTTDHPLTWRGFEPDLDLAEKNVEFGLDGWCVTFLGDGESSAGGVVGEGAGGGVPEGGVEGGCRVEGEGGI